MLIIKKVEAGGIGAELGLVAGDRILALNGHEARDILDYYFHVTGEEVSVRVETGSGQLLEYEIEKDYQEDLGLEFELRPRQCRNQCIFCFIDQQPPNLRQTLYVKDDDYRLSFLHGNYITLTNLSRRDVQRIVGERISPCTSRSMPATRQFAQNCWEETRAGTSWNCCGSSPGRESPSTAR